MGSIDKQRHKCILPRHKCKTRIVYEHEWGSAKWNRNIVGQRLLYFLLKEEVYCTSPRDEGVYAFKYLTAWGKKHVGSRFY